MVEAERTRKRVKIARRVQRLHGETLKKMLGFEVGGVRVRGRRWGMGKRRIPARRGSRR